jgi:nicotine blue oxidoreductase
MGRVAAIVLAAGEASRFGSAKQLLLLPRVLERLGRTSIDEIVVVEGAYELGEIDEARVVRCDDWSRGPGASLRCGLAVLADDVEAVVVIMADGPQLSPAAVERVVQAWGETGGIVAASYGGERGHPLVVGHEHWSDVPDEGLRVREARLVPCDDLGSPGDVDRPEDLGATEPVRG